MYAYILLWRFLSLLQRTPGQQLTCLNCVRKTDTSTCPNTYTQFELVCSPNRQNFTVAFIVVFKPTIPPSIIEASLAILVRAAQ